MPIRMEPNAQQPNQANKPVMDVVPPPKAPAASAQADDVKTPPPMPADAMPATEKPDKGQDRQTKPKAAKPPKTPHSGVGLAVAATVIIVLGLAALFVYAYLRTNNISVY